MTYNKLTDAEIAEFLRDLHTKLCNAKWEVISTEWLNPEESTVSAPLDSFGDDNRGNEFYATALQQIIHRLLKKEK